MKHRFYFRAVSDIMIALKGENVVEKKYLKID